MTTDYDLSPERARALAMLTDFPRPLAQLIVDRPPFATLILRACDYVHFLQAGWITDGPQVALTPLGVAVQSALKPRKQVYDSGRFEKGDQVGITFITPVIGRNTRVRHWVATTDSEYVLKLYPEDFKDLRQVGYIVPDFDCRAPQAVEWEVLVSREQDAKTGWRVAGVVAFTNT